MINKFKKAAITDAANEAQFSANDLLEEIFPLIKSYFIAVPAMDENTIRINFLNGQCYSIIAVPIE